MKKLLLILLGVALVPALMAGPRVVADFFISDEGSVLLPHTDRDARLDLIEYFKAEGAQSRIAPTGTPSSIVEITAMNDTSMNVTARGVTIDIAMFTPVPGDTLLVVSNSFEIGGRTDSSVEVYDVNLQPVNAFGQPVYTDWVIPSERKNISQRVMEQIPFITSRAVLDPKTSTITFVRTTSAEDSDFKSTFVPSLTYVLKKGKLKLVKQP